MKPRALIMSRINNLSAWVMWGILACISCQNDLATGDELSLSTVIQDFGIDTTAFVISTETKRLGDEVVERTVFMSRTVEQEPQIVLSRICGPRECDEATQQARINEERKYLEQDYSASGSPLTIRTIEVSGKSYTILRCGSTTVALSCRNHVLVTLRAYGQATVNLPAPASL